MTNLSEEQQMELALQKSRETYQRESQLRNRGNRNSNPFSSSSTFEEANKNEPLYPPTYESDDPPLEQPSHQYVAKPKKESNRVKVNCPCGKKILVSDDVISFKCKRCGRIFQDEGAFYVYHQPEDPECVPICIPIPVPCVII